MPYLQQPRLLFPRDQVRRVPPRHKLLGLLLDGVQKHLVRRRVECGLFDLEAEPTGLEVFVTSVELGLIYLVELDLVEFAQEPGFGESGFVRIGL